MPSDTFVPPVVLVAAEAEEVRADIIRSLRGYGVRRVEGAPRARAVEAAARCVPDVILIVADQQMKDPVALVTELRASPRTREAPIVVRLGPGGRSTSDGLLVAGADRVLNDGPESAALTGALLSVADVSPDRRAIRNVRRRVAAQRAPTLTQLADALQDSMLALLAADSSGRCAAMNDPLVAATAFARDDVIGRPLWEILEPGNGRDLRTSWATFLVVGTLQSRCALKRKYSAPAPAEVYLSAHVLRDLHVAVIRPVTTRA
ncbi:MAG TPA: PAS domain-containing protein [Vicinamibacterales bacterium]|nr:PAS domain-containing protein [Vicinamibacterales bacterium]